MQDQKICRCNPKLNGFFIQKMFLRKKYLRSITVQTYLNTRRGKMSNLIVCGSLTYSCYVHSWFKQTLISFPFDLGHGIP